MTEDRIKNGLDEEKWYNYWERNGFFKARIAKDKQPYVVVMPPPNVTGVLHMGHLLNQTLQDVFVRRARMLGREACWVPGTDHASIATEAKVVQRLKKRGKTKEEVGRKGFLKEAWKWKEEHEQVIVAQLKRIGISCDWERMRFTMDAERSQAVIKAFVELYKRGAIYQDKRMIHWDPEGKTALSSEEVIYREVQGQLYYIRYKFVECPGEITVATTRPETIFGDTAICVNPEDDRYRGLLGKKVLVPFIGREIPIIADDYVDATFGTGCLKVTPAHDTNDYELGKRHGLEVVDVFTERGLLREVAGNYAGLDRLEARKQVALDLEEAGLLAKREAHVHQVGFSERTGALVEPRLSTQWFVRMQELAKPAIKCLRDGTVRFFPGKFVNMYMAWMENIKDWCISRQLWWGHQIPVYYLADGRFVVAMDAEEAVAKARQLTGNDRLVGADLQQDPDVLDTWFSSWLWPLSVFNGTIDSENGDFGYFYPTDDLVTAPEIIFFWVARMIMAGYAFAGKPPFKKVYFTGIVRDKQRRKMSKSLGNSPSLLGLMDKYGADGVRAGMLLAAPAGNDLLFDEQLCLQGSQFAHKIHHACLLVKGWTPSSAEVSQEEQVAIRWFEARCNEVIEEIEGLFADYRVSEALMSVYRLIWNDFCGRFLEMIKPHLGEPVSIVAHKATLDFFGRLMRLLHPFMPFITEEVWHQLELGSEKKSIMVANWPVAGDMDKDILSRATCAFGLVAKVRQLKAQAGTGKGELTLVVGSDCDWIKLFEGYIRRTTKIAKVQVSSGDSQGVSFVIEGVSFRLLGLLASNEEQIKKLREELAYQEGFLKAVLAKLENPSFVKNAPEVVLKREKKKKEDAIARIGALEKLLELPS